METVCAYGYSLAIYIPAVVSFFIAFLLSQERNVVYQGLHHTHAELVCEVSERMAHL